MGWRPRESAKFGQRRSMAAIFGPTFGVVRLSEPPFLPLARFGSTTPKPVDPK
jgi:hypothetical protein